MSLYHCKDCNAIEAAIAFASMLFTMKSVSGDEKLYIKKTPTFCDEPLKYGYLAIPVFIPNCIGAADMIFSIKYPSLSFEYMENRNHSISIVFECIRPYLSSSGNKPR